MSARPGDWDRERKENGEMASRCTLSIARETLRKENLTDLLVDCREGARAVVRRTSSCSFYKVIPLLLSGGLLCIVAVGCVTNVRHHGESNLNEHLTSDTRYSIVLSTAAGNEHRAIMLQDLETIQAIANALVEEDYELAQDLAKSQLGYFTHRRMLALRELEQFPPPYHELTMAQHEAAGELARSMATQDPKQILWPFNNVLKTCVACHREYKIADCP